MVRFIYTLTLGLALLAGTEVAFAGPPTTPQTNSPAMNNQPNGQPVNNRPVVLQGRENLPGMGELTFIVRDNDVQMIDATRRPVNGKGQVVGSNRIVMTFGNCVYEGDYINGVYAGTARFTSGQNAGQSWTFNTRFAGNL